jgi:hypothetical protein
VLLLHPASTTVSIRTKIMRVLFFIMPSMNDNEGAFYTIRQENDTLQEHLFLQCSLAHSDSRRRHAQRELLPAVAGHPPKNKGMLSLAPPFFGGGKEPVSIDTRDILC